VVVIDCSLVSACLRARQLRRGLAGPGNHVARVAGVSLIAEARPSLMRMG
jgi:hypothetical protein